MEHSPSDVSTILGQLQAVQSTDTVPLVRPYWNDSILVKRLLDLGVPALLFPMVQSAEEALSAVAATRYPPKAFVVWHSEQMQGYWPVAQINCWRR